MLYQRNAQERITDEDVNQERFLIFLETGYWLNHALVFLILNERLGKEEIALYGTYEDLAGIEDLG